MLKLQTRRVGGAELTHSYVEWKPPDARSRSTPTSWIESSAKAAAEKKSDQQWKRLGAGASNDEQPGSETIPGSKPKPAPASHGAGGGPADESAGARG